MGEGGHGVPASSCSPTARGAVPAPCKATAEERNLTLPASLPSAPAETNGGADWSGGPGNLLQNPAKRQRLPILIAITIICKTARKYNPIQKKPPSPGGKEETVVLCFLPTLQSGPSHVALFVLIQGHQSPLTRRKGEETSAVQDPCWSPGPRTEPCTPREMLPCLRGNGTSHQLLLQLVQRNGISTSRTLENCSPLGLHRVFPQYPLLWLSSLEPLSVSVASPTSCPPAFDFELLGGPDAPRGARPDYGSQGAARRPAGLQIPTRLAAPRPDYRSRDAARPRRPSSKGPDSPRGPGG
ncbi:uncharacterized protein LOC119930440 [Tachyglossus aculeatus]|uniref:uncharacterized protein LOC119930440 n=1 Tax=Tachyglossus aculeatus TaxID=9261 RepID=UPI0018F58225|nr:uncharacterized protein LOC119930440 [Tachyglossus aculeatus]